MEELWFQLVNVVRMEVKATEKESRMVVEAIEIFLLQ